MYLTSWIHFAHLSGFIRHRIYILFICSLFASCSTVPNELRIAEQLMEDSPDSALRILQKSKPTDFKSPSHRALYGLLVFQALDKKDKPLQPDSLIDFSINYYLGENNKLNLAKSYFLKAKMNKKSQQFEDAVTLYLKSLDLINSTDNYLLLGKIYSDLGDICILQKDYSESLKKVSKAIDYFNKAGNRKEPSYRVVTIGKIYRFRKDYKLAHKYFKKALSQASDSLLQGFAFQEIGINYYWVKQYDSAQFYLRRSLQFPYTGPNYSIRYFYLADLLYNTAQYDSAFCYAQLALKYPSNFFNQRDCYRILANTKYHQNDFEKMGLYLSKYQDCTDSVRKIEIQAKVSMLESLHNNSQETTGTKRSMIWIVSMLVLVLLFSTIIVYFLIQRNKFKKRQLTAYKQELNQKQEFVNLSLHKKIAEAREAQSEARRNASPEERARLDKELYEKCLHLSNWDTFSCEMNHAFNQIVNVLQSSYSGITQKEITWCCLQLFDIPNADRILLLNATTDSMYKLKQRLAQKMNLASTKELDAELKRISNLKL
jgi:tetratricopeptide (TPR) repeat protein